MSIIGSSFPRVGLRGDLSALELLFSIPLSPCTCRPKWIQGHLQCVRASSLPHNHRYPYPQRYRVSVEIQRFRDGWQHIRHGDHLVLCNLSSIHSTLTETDRLSRDLSPVLRGITALLELLLECGLLTLVLLHVLLGAVRHFSRFFVLSKVLL